MKIPTVFPLFALALVFAGPLAAQPASAARTVPSLELPRYKTSGNSDAPLLASTKVMVDDLASTGSATARAATRNEVPYLAVDAGQDLSRPIRGGARDVTFVSFQLQGSTGTTLDIAGAQLAIGPANKDGFAPLRVGQPNGNNKTPTWRDLPHVVKVETFDGAPLAVLPVVTVRLDPVAGNWDLSIFQRLVAEDLPLINPPRGANKTFDLHAVVGGTASVIGGGKFANGAAFGAFQYVVSNVPTRAQLESSPLAGAGIAGKMMIDRVIGENFGAAWRSMLTEKWVNSPTGGKLPESLANGMMDVVRSAPVDAAANGMHAWHAGSNTYLAGKLGLIGAPALIAGGLFHESPLDWRSFMAEQSGVPDPATGVRQGGQGTVNHILESTMDIVANVFGMVSGYANPGFVNFAVKWGNYIPGPGDPDPTMPGGGGGTHQYTGDPRAAWGPGPVKSW